MSQARGWFIPMRHPGMRKGNTLVVLVAEEGEHEAKVDRFASLPPPQKTAKNYRCRLGPDEKGGPQNDLNNS